ncbi:MAG: DUF4838 domain-containing protein [Phocaeicola sp.]
MIQRTLLLFLFLASAFVASGYSQPVSLVKSGKPTGRIVVCNQEASTNEAAQLLQRFIFETTQAQLPIVPHSKPFKRGDVALASGSLEGVTEDGFRIQTREGVVHINGLDRGVLYGTVTLLEQYVGVNYLSEHTYTLSPTHTLTLPEIARVENPAFRYRQTQCYAMATDSVYKSWFRLEQPKEEFAANMWVHTFNTLLPSEVYGKSHPEYYSFINGERRPGKASQWCLTNPDLLEVIVAKVDSIFKANPAQSMISISQNDGNFTYCRCEACEEVNHHEGSPAGNYIHFLNKLAARFPDKQLSTLAYLFTMHPPKHVKPLDNVNIMLCNIDCDREVPLTDNASGQLFMSALEKWSKVSNNLFIWDYGINFDNMVAPFPNFPILQANIQQFYEHHATMHFSQIGGTRGGDFSEMRAYVVSKLMWDPYCDVDSVMQKFMADYYGDAARHIYSYEKSLEGALLASQQRLWIYDSPVSHKEGMLNAAARKRYNAYFDLAEQAVAHDSLRLMHVRRSRLPLQYSELEIARAEGITDPVLIEQKLQLFEQRTQAYTIPTLNERNNRPDDYCRLYRDRFLHPDASNIAKGAQVEWIVAPTGKYKELGGKALTDGILGGTTFVENWIGWEGVDASFVLNLGSSRTFSSVHVDCLHQIGAWILSPLGVKIYLSDNNVDYTLWGEQQLEEDQSGVVKFVEAGYRSATPAKAQYIKIEIESLKICPSWHYGVGYPAWIFVDEVFVR